MPIGRPMASTDPKATSRMTTAASRPIASPRPVGASSKAKNRSPLASTCSGEPARTVGRQLFEVVQVRRVQLLHHGVLHPDQRDPAVGRRPVRDVVPEHLRQVAASSAGELIGRCASRGRHVQPVAVVARGDDDLGGRAQPGPTPPAT